MADLRDLIAFVLTRIPDLWKHEVDFIWRKGVWTAQVENQKFP